MRIYDTLQRSQVEFQPQDPGHVRMYTCGPTVYDFPHIGNYRAYVWEDLLRRTLHYLGFRVTQVMNITDVEDKIIRKMQEEGESLEEVTAPFIEAFFQDLDTLRIQRAEHYPRATEHIDEMVEIAQKLRERGHTYESQGSLYFKISSLPGYGKLSHLDEREIRVGARVDQDEYEKEDARDFVLWKASREGEPYWDTALGRGRPGWHLECSAMSMKYLGTTLDLHTGGVDNIFPHHENEIAQSEGATGETFVRFWMHVAHLMVDGEKMAKSKGNFYTLRDVLDRGHDPRTVRLLLLSTHYRSPLNFTFDALAQSAAEVERLDDLRARLAREAAADGSNEVFDAKLADAQTEFRDCLADDLNVSGALGALFRIVREAHSAMDRGELPASSRESLVTALDRMDSVLDVMSAPEETLDAEVEALIEKRTNARKTKDFAEADRIRDELLSRGIVLEDTPEGVRWKRKRIP